MCFNYFPLIGIEQVQQPYQLIKIQLQHARVVKTLINRTSLLTAHYHLVHAQRLNKSYTFESF